MYIINSVDKTKFSRDAAPVSLETNPLYWSVKDPVEAKCRGSDTGHGKGGLKGENASVS